MKKVTLFLLASLFLMPFSFADDVTDVQTRVTQIQDTDPSLPSISEQKGIYGTILSKIFDTNGKIKDIFLQIVGSLSSGDVPRWDGSQFVSGVITDNGTNVGIGTTNPQTELHVVTSTGLNADISITSGGYAWTLSTTTNGSFILNKDIPGTLPTITALQSGYVGIGTTSPGYKLDVNGSIRAQGQYYYAGSNRIYGDNNSGLYHFSNNDTVSQLLMADKQGTLYGRLYGASDGIDFGLIDGDGDWGVRMNKDNYTSFAINNSEKMRITSSGAIGIGTDDPQQELHIKGINAGIRWESNETGTDVFEINNGGWSGNYGLAFQDRTTAGDPVRLFIANGGNVGIGTTNPTYKLDVNGDIKASGLKVYGNEPNSRKGLTIEDSNGTAMVLSSGTHQNGLAFYTNSDWSVAKMVVQENGNVGIGTTNPIEKLTINGGIAIGNITQSPYYRIVVDGSGNNEWWYSDGNKKMNLYANGNLWIAGSYSSSSDVRLKKDISTLDDSLNKVSNLRGVHFNWKNENQDPHLQIGLIAQEVEKEFPELVSTDNEGMKSVNYSGLVAPLIEAVKELKQQNEEQTREIEKLQEQVKRLQ